MRKLACIALVAVVGTAGCSVSKGGSGGTVDRNTRRLQQFQELMGRPDIEQAAQRYDEMTAALRGRLENDAGVGQWHEDPRSGSRAGCNSFPDVELEDKESRGLRLWLSDGSMPDEKWAQVVAIAQDIASKYAFETPPRTIVDRPGDHEITTADAFGADLILGTKLNTVLQVRTGCHLRAEARLRGTPSIPQYG